MDCLAVVVFARQFPPAGHLSYVDPALVYYAFVS